MHLRKAIRLIKAKAIVDYVRNLMDNNFTAEELARLLVDYLVGQEYELYETVTKKKVSEEYKKLSLDEFSNILCNEIVKMGKRWIMNTLVDEYSWRNELDELYDLLVDMKGKYGKPEIKILKLPDLGRLYDIAKEFGKRFPKNIERRFLSKPFNMFTISYAIDIVKNRWPELEEAMLKAKPNSAFEYSSLFKYLDKIVKGPWPELMERLVINDPMAASGYASIILKRRWPELEPVIMKDPEAAYIYAERVIKGRWPEAEPVIMKDPDIAYEYAVNIINGRWPEAEPYIKKDPEAWELYRREFRKSTKHAEVIDVLAY